MKRFYQIGAAILIIGLALLFVGKMNDGNQSFGIFRAVVSGHDNHDDHDDYDDDHDDDDDDDDWSYNQKIETVSNKVAKFSKIKLDVYHTDVQISLGEKYKVTVSGPNAKKISTSVSTKELTISDHNKNFSGRKAPHKVEITVPNRKTLKKLTGTCSENDLFLHGLTIPYINLKFVDGDIRISDAVIKNAKFFIRDGDLVFNSSRFKTTASLNDGDVSITNSKLLGNSTFNLTDSDFKMVNPPKISYNLSTDLESDLRVQGSYHSNHYIKKVANAHTLKVVSVDGDILII